MAIEPVAPAVDCVRRVSFACAIVAHVAEREGQHVAADRRIGDRWTIDLRAAGLIFEALGQHQHHASRANRQLSDIQLGGVQQLRRGSNGGFQLQRHAAFRHEPARQHEVTAPQRTAANVDELRVGAAGIAHMVDAAGQLMRIGNRDRIHLHDVRARHDVFEVILAFVVGDRIAAVFEVHAHACDALQLLRRLAQSPSTTRPITIARLRNNSSRN